jgi:hypothetical protein
MKDKFDFNEMMEIARAAELHTRAIKHKQNTFFKKRLRSVIHLHDKGSKLVTNPIAIIAEHLYKLWEIIRDGSIKLYKAIYPRKYELVGGIKDAAIVGRITFATRQDQFIPIHHIHLEFWGRTNWGNYKLFAEDITDEDGRFRLEFNMSKIHAFNIREHLHLEIYHTGSFCFLHKHNNLPEHEHELFKCIKFHVSDLTGMEYDLGTLQLFYWEYRTDTILPRVVIKDHDKDAPQKYSRGRIDAIAEQFIPIELITRKHERLIKADQDITIEDIQEDYPENLTVAMEKEKPGLTRSDAWFGERMMNGMFAGIFDKDPEDPSQFWLHHHWTSYEHTDKYALHDITMKFRLNDEGYLLPTEIKLKGPLHKKDFGSKEVHVFTPQDGSRWEGAKRVARVSAGILTEIDRHFAETHLNTEQYAIAINRNITRNPIGAILYPHLRGVTLINHQADQILVSDDGYIARATALTGAGTRQRATDVMGTLDWLNWSPIQPISDKHVYAKAANLYWDMLVEYVGDYIKDHKEAIVEEWHEIFTFAKDLTEHSVPVFLCKHLQKALGVNPAIGQTGEVPDWFSKQNRMDFTVSRPKVSDHLGYQPNPAELLEPAEEEVVAFDKDQSSDHMIHRAVSYVTQNKVYDTASTDMDNLKQVCAYVIFQATFGHFWANSKQYDDIGEIRYNSLGIRWGSGPDGVVGPEEDDEITPDKIISTQMMWWSNMLSRTGYGYIMSNEEKDINPDLIKRLKDKEKEFADLGIDIYDIQSRTNI